jgi:hypothetical protein
MNHGARPQIEYQTNLFTIEELIHALKQKFDQLLYILRADHAVKLNVNGYLNLIESYVRLNSVNQPGKFSQMLKA